MEPRNNQELWNQRKSDIIVIGILLAFAWFINSGIEIKGLYMDDLYLWSCYGEQSFQEYVFPMGGTRCRFIYYLAAWLEMALVGNHVSWFIPINIAVNGMVAITIYFMAKNLSRDYLLGFLCGFMFLLSRMAYYQISQVWGLMESLALWLAIAILYLLFCYLNHDRNGAKKGIKSREHFINGAVILYFLVCFVHERYMVLLPLFFIVLLLKKNRSLKTYLKPAGSFLLVQLIRYFAIGGLAPAGTGGTEVADTFSVKEVIGYAIRQVAYIFGLNAGPEYLNGQNVKDSPIWVMVFLVIADLALLIFIVMFVVHLIRDKSHRSRHLSNALLFVLFIGACIAGSSVTIRLEMRWIYVSFTAALLFLAYMYGVVTENKHNPGRWLKVLPMRSLIVVYVLAMIPVETNYRSQYPNLYYWSNQLRYNSLAEQTYDKYGDEIFGKSIYIIGNDYDMSQFTADTFFKVFDKARKAEGTQVIHIDSYRDIGLVTDQMLILKEEPAGNAFQDVTAFIRDMKVERISGCYQDGWVDEEAAMIVMTGASGRIELEVTYPGNLQGQEVISVTYGNDVVAEWPLTGNITTHSITTQPYTFVPITFHTNFYMPDALEQRGEQRLAFLLELTAD